MLQGEGLSCFFEDGGKVISFFWCLGQQTFVRSPHAATGQSSKLTALPNVYPPPSISPPPNHRSRDELTSHHAQAHQRSAHARTNKFLATRARLRHPLSFWYTTKGPMDPICSQPGTDARIDCQGTGALGATPGVVSQQLAQSEYGVTMPGGVATVEFQQRPYLLE
jgi:hypothetical protein